MNALAALLTTLGAIGLIYFFVFFDVSVPGTDGGRIVNLGLLADRQNGLLVSVGLLIVGAILTVGARRYPTTAERAAAVAEPTGPLVHSAEQGRHKDGLYSKGLTALAIVVVAAIAGAWWYQRAPSESEALTPSSRQTLLANASEAQRFNILRSLITGEGRECREVTAAYFRGTDRDGDAYWSASCYQGQSYQIRLSRTDVPSPQVVACSDIGTNQCFQPLR
jgi:hypothetical protein